MTASHRRRLRRRDYNRRRCDLWASKQAVPAPYSAPERNLLRASIRIKSYVGCSTRRPMAQPLCTGTEKERSL